MSVISELKSYAKMTNLLDEADLSQEKLDKIKSRVMTGFLHDEQSCSEWLADVKKVEKLCSLKAKKKNFPLPNSANIKFPLITKACYEFSSRTYPEIMKDGKVVKARVIGIDPVNEKQDKADRVTDYLNYQLLLANPDWEKDLDVLLTRLALIGFICKKSYYDPIRKRIVDKICDPCDLIINSDVKCLEDARRISHVIHLHLNDLIEHVNSDLFCEEPISLLKDELETDELDPCIDIVEQHTFLDLDDDGYAEPYIVTFLKEKGDLLRIAPRYMEENIVGKGDELEYITPIQLFTDFHFLVSPQGKFQSVGFGILMLHLNETINSILNQLVDAGQLANMAGGYKDSRLKNMGSGNSLHNPGEWKTVKAMGGIEIKNGLVPITYKEPSSVLFKLLELLIQTGKDLSSSTEVMTGATSADNAKTGAVQSLQAEGLKVFTSIQKRLYRSLTSEFKRIFNLDSIYLDAEEYYEVLNDKKAIKRIDFNAKELDIVPTADPNMSSELQRAQRNQVYAAAMQMPGTDKLKLTELILQNSNLGVPVKEIMLPPEAQNKPDPAMLELQAKIHNMGEQNALKGHELMIREQEAKVEFYKVQAQVLELKSQAMLNVAQAQAQQDNGKFQEYRLQLDILSKHLEALSDAADFLKDSQQHQNEMGMRQQELDQNQQEIDNNAQQSKQEADQGMAGEPGNS